MIYEIVCNETGERYIGSTFEPTLARRLAYHKCDTKKKITCKSAQIINRKDYYINLLEKVDVNTRDELRQKEREWFDKLPNINKNKPHTTKEEKQEYIKKHYDDNSLAKIEYQKKYVEDNYNKVQEYRQQYRDTHKEKRKEYDVANRDKANARRRELYALKKI
jgi:hypothetical protein